MSRSEPFVVCSLADSLYAVPARYVQQLEMLETVTRVPGAAPAVDGVVYVRGQVVPVLNLRALFGLERIPYDLQSRLIVIGLDERVVGLAVDAAREFATFPEQALGPPPATLNGQHLAGVIATAERLLLILDVERILAAETGP